MTIKKVGAVIGLIVLAILPGGFLLLALGIAGVKIFKREPKKPDPKKLAVGQRRRIVTDATGLYDQPMGWVGREFIILGPGEYDGWDAEVQWIDGKGCNIKGGGSSPDGDCDDLGYEWIRDNTIPVE